MSLIPDGAGSNADPIACDPAPIDLQPISPDGERTPSTLSAVSSAAAGCRDDGPNPDDPVTDIHRSLQAVTPVASKDFPRVRSLAERPEFTWDEDKAPVDNYDTFGRALAESGDLYRISSYGGGLFLASEHPNVHPIPVNDAGQLQAIILDRVVVKVVKNGKPKGGGIPAVHHRTMLRSEAFLQQFRPIDGFIDRPMYLQPDFRLTMPGYNDGGFGHRILHVGRSADISQGRDAIERFLDVMTLETDADRANTSGAALLVMLRNFWPGGKPIIIVTSTKSHGGKETVIHFVGVSTSIVSIDYEEADSGAQTPLHRCHPPESEGRPDQFRQCTPREGPPDPLRVRGALPDRSGAVSLQHRGRPTVATQERPGPRHVDELRRVERGLDESRTPDSARADRGCDASQVADREPEARIPPGPPRAYRGGVAGHDQALEGSGAPTRS